MTRLERLNNAGDHLMLQAGVLALGVLADGHQVDVVVARFVARQREAGAHIGIQLRSAWITLTSHSSSVPLHTEGTQDRSSRGRQGAHIRETNGVMVRPTKVGYALQRPHLSLRQHYPLFLQQTAWRNRNFSMWPLTHLQLLPQCQVEGPVALADGRRHGAL